MVLSAFLILPMSAMVILLYLLKNFQVFSLFFYFLDDSSDLTVMGKKIETQIRSD